MDEAKLKRILCAEDEDDLREIAEVSLEHQGGFIIKMCSNGKEAIKAAAGFKPDLLLLDVMMPDMTGMDVLKEVRSNPKLAKVPAIFLTARVQAHEIAEYKELGVFEVISKPFNPMALPDRIREIWKKIPD